MGSLELLKITALDVFNSICKFYIELGKYSQNTILKIFSGLSSRVALSAAKKSLGGRRGTMAYAPHTAIWIAPKGPLYAQLLQRWTATTA